MPIITNSAPETTRTAVPKPATSAAVVPTIPEVVAATAEAPAEEKKLSPQYAALARREMELRKRDEAIKAREAAMEAQSKAKEEEYSTKYIPKDKLAKDPLSAIYESGMTKDQLIDLLLNGPAQVDPVTSKLEERQAAIEAKLEEQARAQAEQSKQAYDRAVAEIRKQADTLVASNEDYATIKETNSAEAVVELIKQTYEAEGVLLSVEDAAKQVEDHLLEEALKMAGLTKVKAKLTPIEQIADLKTPETFKKTPAAPQTPNIKTLTNAATSAPSKPLTAMSRKERAILAFKGQLT